MRFIPLIFVLVIIAILLTFVPVMFGSFETEHNMTVSNYTEEYDALTSLTQTDMVILGVIGTLLVLGMVFIVARLFLR